MQKNCCLLCKTILKVTYLIIILWISLEKGECFEFNHSLGCVCPTLYMIRFLDRVYHFSLVIYYHCSHHNLNWESALINVIRKETNKTLVNTDSQYSDSSVIALKQSDEACIAVGRYVSEGNPFCFPITQYVTQYDLVTDLKEDNSLTKISGFVILWPAVDESNYN